MKQTYRHIERHIFARLLRIVSGIILMVSFMPVARAQGDAEFSQYWAMPSYYNPAAIGNTDYVRIRLAGKLQWVGIERAPRTFAGTADMPLQFGKKLRFGVGLLANSERIGLYQNLNVGLQLGYKFRALKGEFTIGVQPALYNTKFKGSDVYIPEGDDFHQPADPEIPTTDISGNAFDLSAGVQYNHKYFSVGLSCLHILEPEVTLDSEGGSDKETVEFMATLPRQAYFTADGNIPLRNSLISLQPSLLVRTDFKSFSAEATMRATYNKFISLGIGYRTSQAVTAMLSVEFKNFFLGYAYDYSFTGISKASSGSHELMAGYRVKLNFGQKNKNKQRSIRIM
ncbi:MAG: type IX secretion system membrane protein PorP/SprF [Muribaculaceae bacterium]|nr:type IX secretion system membrane protein PorP/SprF [Muribaculaceae bacterium]